MKRRLLIALSSLLLACGGGTTKACDDCDAASGQRDLASCSSGDSTCDPQCAGILNPAECLAGNECDPGAASCGTCTTPNKACHFVDNDIDADFTCVDGKWSITIIDTTNPLCVDGGT